MSKSVRIPDPVHEKAKELKEIHDYSSIGEGVRHMCREGGYDV